MKKYNEFTEIPNIHPNKDINTQIFIQSLIDNLDTARNTLNALISQTTKLDPISKNHLIKWTLEETDPNLLVS